MTRLPKRGGDESPLPRVSYVVWGLRREARFGSLRAHVPLKAHSHRYIHAGWARALKRMGLDVHWLDDDPRHVSRVPEGSIVLASNMAQMYLPVRSDLRYILHNVAADEPGLEDLATRAIWWQVWTRDATGPLTDIPCVTLDRARRTIFQPWGTPFPKETWKHPLRGGSRHEYWIGSVWDNAAGQGNRKSVVAWLQALKRHGVTFRKAPRGWPDSPYAYSALVQRPALAAAIAGTWQAEMEYAPCRLFKNVGSGALPISNDPVVLRIFGDVGLHNGDLAGLIESGRSLSFAERRERTMHAQQTLALYTYEESLRRAIGFLTELVP